LPKVEKSTLRLSTSIRNVLGMGSSYSRWANQVGGPGGKNVKKHLCRQRIVFVPKTPEMHSGRGGGVDAIQSSCSFIWCSCMRQRWVESNFLDFASVWLLLLRPRYIWKQFLTSVYTQKSFK